MLASPISQSIPAISLPYHHTLSADPRHYLVRTKPESTKSYSKNTQHVQGAQFVNSQELWATTPKRSLSFVSDTSSASSSSSSSRRAKPAPRGVSYKDLVQTRTPAKARAQEGDNEVHTAFLYAFPESIPTPPKRHASTKPKRRKAFVDETIQQMKHGRLFPPDATEIAQLNRNNARRRTCRADRLLFEKLIAKSNEFTPRPSPLPTPPPATLTSTICNTPPSRSNSDFSEIASTSTLATSVASCASPKPMSGISLLWLQAGEVQTHAAKKTPRMNPTYEHAKPCARVFVNLEQSPLGTITPQDSTEQPEKLLEQRLPTIPAPSLASTIWNSACAFADAYARVTLLNLSAYAPTEKLDVIRTTVPPVVIADPALYGYRARSADVRKFLELSSDSDDHQMEYSDTTDEKEESTTQSCGCVDCNPLPRLRPIANPITLRVRAISNSQKLRSNARVRSYYPGVLGSGGECVLSWARPYTKGGSPLVKEAYCG